MKKTILFFSTILALTANELSGQSDRANVFPPTPDVASIGKFIDQPMSLSRGIPEITVPIYNLAIGSQWSYPINLQYQAGGIRVEEMAGKTGLGWNMTGMGMITRTVKDLPDDTAGSGYMYTSYGVEKLKVLVNESQGTNTVNVMKEYIDAEPDEYTVSVNGIQFRFFYDKQNARFVQAPLSGVKLEPQYNNSQIISWILTNTDGTKYYFGTNSNVEYSDFSQNTTLSSDSSGAGGADSTPLHILTWYLVKIEDTNKNVVEFQYKQNPLYDYYSKVGESAVKYNDNHKAKYINYNLRKIRSMGLEKIKYNTTEILFIEDETNRLDMKNTKALKEVQVKDNNRLIKKIILNYSYFTSDNSQPYDHFYYFPENGYRLKLDNINIYNGTDPKPQKYEFIYNSRQLPSKFSYSQDAWGFYNGVSNTELIPKTLGEYTNVGTAKRNVYLEYAKACVLEKIIYPTGGFTTYEYESNTVSRVMRSQGRLNFGEVLTQNFWLETEKDIDPEHITIIDKPQYKGRLVVNRPSGYVNFMTTVEGCTNQLNSSDCKYTVKIVGVNNPTNIVVAQSELYLNLPKGEYDVIAVKSGNGSSQTLGFSVVAYWDELTDDPFNLIVGGLRAKRINFFDSNGTKLFSKQYEYNKIENGKVISSGNLLDYPVFVFNYSAGLNFSESKVSSTPVSPLANLSMASVIYDNVIEKRIDSQSRTLGHTDYSYTFDMKADPEYHTEGTINSDLTTSIFSWRNGLLLYKNDFDENNILLRSVINDYSSKNKLTISNFGGYFEARKRNATPFYSYLFYPFVTDTYSIDTSETTEYFNGKAIKKQTAYYYNNPQHYQLTSQKGVSSDGSTAEINYQYAHEQNNTDMIGANMISIPLQTEVKENGKIISKTRTIYGKNSQTNNLIQPLSSQTFVNDNSSLANTVIDYNQYDAQGHLLQYTVKGGVPTAIIWGYNNTLPIAKIEGATYQETANLASDIITKSNEDIDTDKEKILMNSLDSFRNQDTFKNFKITTYTYDPLIGVTSVTPPTGVRELYKYDTSGRLQSVVDANNNIIKELNYNYKN